MRGYPGSTSGHWAFDFESATDRQTCERVHTQRADLYTSRRYIYSCVFTCNGFLSNYTCDLAGNWGGRALWVLLLFWRWRRRRICLQITLSVNG